MNRKNLVPALAVVFLTTASAFAQGSTTQTRPQPPSQNLPISKIAVIFSAEFQNPKTGVARFNVLLNNLNAEFQKTQVELNQMAQRVNQISDDLNKTRNTADPKATQQKMDQLDQLKKDYKRRAEDAQAAYQKRRVEVLTPLQDDVGKALDVYAKSHAIAMVIDGSQVQGIVYASESIDITRAFISDYNIKNPVAASVTTPK